MKTVWLETDDRGEIVWHPVFLDFARYWGFTSPLCRPYRAQTKGKVESSVKYVRRNFLCGLQGREPGGIADLNANPRTIMSSTVRTSRASATPVKWIQARADPCSNHSDPKRFRVTTTIRHSTTIRRRRNGTSREPVTLSALFSGTAKRDRVAPRLQGLKYGLRDLHYHRCHSHHSCNWHRIVSRLVCCGTAHVQRSAATLVEGSASCP
jgi:hypothetical protein